MWIVWLEKKILGTLGIILGIIIILVTALHIYVVNNAESLIEELVATESKGKLKLKVDNIKFNYFTRKVELQHVSFYSNDSLDLSTAYRFEVENIRLKVKALIPIFTRRELRIDSIFLVSPKVEVIRLKEIVKSGEKQVSVPEEMGRIYNSMIDALNMLEVSRFQFDNGQFRLINKVRPDQLPLELTNLHFHIDNFKVDSTKTADDFLFTDQMVFRTRNQNIIFPDSNHRLAFSRFRINIRKELIEIDSCTITSKKGGDSRSGFSIFLDTLKLTNVDFKAMYEKELIKADSVYCLNPKFDIQFEIKDKKTNAAAPNLDTIINQLTGDLQLNYIGVKNASLNIEVHSKDKSTSFRSEKNNFEMQGLTIDHSLPHPVSLTGFDMAIRNYENFVKDSSYFLRFDSIRLRENRILLSNFSINTEPYKDKRNIRVQQFVLSGLSWSDLLIDRRIVASQATLVRPVIDYVQTIPPRQENKGPFSASLASINDIMSLDKIQIENGKIKIRTLKGLELTLEETFLLLNTKNIDDSLTIEKTETSIETLSFKKGVLKTKQLMVNMENAGFTGSTNKLFIDKIKLYNHKQTFNINAKGFKLDSIFYTENENKIFADGIGWKSAEVEINTIEAEKEEKNFSSIIELNNLRTENTLLRYNSVKGSLSVFLNTLTADAIEKGDKLKINGLKTAGKDLSWYTQVMAVTAGTFDINDQSVSTISSFQFKDANGKNAIDMKIPEMEFIPDLSSIMANKPEIKNVKLKQPEIFIQKAEKLPGEEPKSLPDLKINTIDIISPVFRMENSASKGVKSVYWNGSNNKVYLKNISSAKTENIFSVVSARLDISDLSFVDSTGKTTATKNGHLDLGIKDVNFRPGKEAQWSLTLEEVKAENFRADSIGKNAATIIMEKGVIENLVIGSAINSSLQKIISSNPAFTISDLTVRFDDIKSKWKFHNLILNRKQQTISVDSFSYRPVMNRDEFIAASPFQTDYMTFQTGKINVTGFDPDQYLEDSSFMVRTVKIQSPYFTAYRDKRPPFNAGIIKPLAAKLIQKMPGKVSIDTVLIQNGTGVYTELNDKTNETGIVPLTRISGDIFPIKNFNITEKDSLRIRLNFYLLDSAWVRLRTRESYLDSLSGFLITLRMRPRSLLYLNKVLEPLASVKLQSGYLDTLSMRAVGQEYLSLGEMRMFYHDLKVQFLSNDTEEKKKFLRGLKTFVANSFVIKNENHKKTGVVYFPRIRDRSFMNYYIKIALSGVASSMGAKKNKRVLRRYEKQIKMRQLPPIDFD